MVNVFVVIERHDEGRVGIIRRKDSAWIMEESYPLAVGKQGNAASGGAASRVEEREVAPGLLGDF